MTAFAKTREVGGKPLGEYQLVAGMLADSATELFAARSMLYEVARSIDAGLDRKIVHGQASMAKLYCSEMAGRVADRAVQVFGGRGYMRENVAERMFRELRVERIWEGASEIQRVIVARQMLNRGRRRCSRGSEHCGLLRGLTEPDRVRERVDDLHGWPAGRISFNARIHSRVAGREKFCLKGNDVFDRHPHRRARSAVAMVLGQVKHEAVTTKAHVER